MSESINSKNKLTISYIFLIINFLMSLLIANQISTLLSTLFLIYIYVQLYRLNPVGVFILSPLIFLQLSVQISLMAIEHGAFMKEMARYGYLSASSSAYSILSATCITTAIIFFNNLDNRFSSKFDHHKFEVQPRLLKIIGPLVLIFAILYMLAKGYLTGFPLLAGFDRFEYRFNVGDPILLNLLILKFLLGAFLAASALNVPKNKRWISHFIFLTYIAVSFLFGDKFFGVINALLFYFAVVFTSEPREIEKYEIPFLTVFFIASVLAFSFTYYIYSGSGQLDSASTFEKIFERFAEQGQLWFVHFNEGFTWLDFQYDDIRLNIDSVFERYGQSFAFNNRLGAFYFMPKYAPSNIYLSFMRNSGNVTPTMSFEPYMTYLFGYLGALIVMIAIGAILGNVAYWIYKSILMRNPFNILLPAYVFSVLVSVLNTGTIYLLFSLSTIKAYIAIFALTAIVNSTLARYRTYSWDSN